MRCQIKIIKEMVDIFQKYQPKVGKIYDAIYSPATHRRDGDYSGKAEFCVINVLDKKIIVRPGEYEIVRLCNG